ncbi:MAG TPA: TerB family tellurite resistance protein [Acidocella sp.]|jgi:DnaJ like chaperone protein|uniref:TerB family tellurite resistance protein n=1 Tax=Acidocella sp. TaxID=50710 RepID=UPI002BFA7EF6|nr:TerB family tellurite resistance protein [Acidocella sp.]HVE23464.1 TerB family tellurite resistance protein [Acidocella sp.]
MSYWGKIIGGVAGFAVGGPAGALFGAALGHAADEGVVSGIAAKALPFEAMKMAALFGRRDQIFAVSVTVLAAKLAKCDGPVTRAEIDMFKRSFSIPESSVAEIGRLFDRARESATGYENYALQLGQAFADNRILLEQVLAGLYQIARADGPVNADEEEFLNRVARRFRLDDVASGRAEHGTAAPHAQAADDAYAVLGLDRKAGDDAVRARWKSLMRENHPDSLASRGVPQAMIDAASDRVARINAAYDKVKRERKL